jgi:non-heme chloroperoxidase
MTPAIKSIELPRRVRLPDVEQGDPSGLPMILLHGVTDSWRSFERVLSHLRILPGIRPDAEGPR